MRIPYFLPRTSCSTTFCPRNITPVTSCPTTFCPRNITPVTSCPTTFCPRNITPVTSCPTTFCPRNIAPVTSCPTTNFVGQDVTGAISLGQNVVGQEVSGAGRRGAELFGAGRRWGKISGSGGHGAGSGSPSVTIFCFRQQLSKKSRIGTPLESIFVQYRSRTTKDGAKSFQVRKMAYSYRFYKLANRFSKSGQSTLNMAHIQF